MVISSTLLSASGAKTFESCFARLVAPVHRELFSLHASLLGLVEATDVSLDPASVVSVLIVGKWHPVVLWLSNQWIGWHLSVTFSHAVVSLKVVIIVREIAHRVEIIVELVLIFVHDAACVGMRQLPLLVMSQAVLSLLMVRRGFEKIVFVIIMVSIVVGIVMDWLCVVIVHSADKSVMVGSIMMIDNLLMDNRLMMLLDKNVVAEVM
jgi:hypothetical protein